MFNRCNELIFLNRLGEEGNGAFLHGAIAMLGARARSYDHYRDAARCGALAKLNHELVTGHARHLEVGDDQVAAVLGDEFGSFQAVGGKFHAIAILLQHAPDEFADAYGVVGDDDDALVLDAIDGVGGNRAACDGFRTGSKDACGAGAGLQSAALVGIGGDHAI